MKKGLLILILLLTVIMANGCKKNPSPKPLEELTYYKETKMNEEKTLYVFNRNESLTDEQQITATAIQGIYAKKAAKFYFYQSGAYEKWLNDLSNNYGIKFIDITFEDMLKMFLKDYNNNYVLYDYKNNKESVNCACTVAGIYEYLPVDVTLMEYVESLGFENKLNVTSMSEKKCFNTYKDQLNKDGLVQIRQDLVHMRDYAIACKYFMFYQDDPDPSALMFRGSVHSWANPNTPIFGWGPNNEDEHVTISSQNGQFTLASDYCLNMSVFTCVDTFGRNNYVQKYKETNVKAEKGKHYVCIMMSDGDNVQTWYNLFPFSEKYFGAQRGNFTMGWSMQPSLIDLGPNILNYMYDNLQKGDYYVCSVSGQGYIYPQVYPQLDEFLEGLSYYLRLTDMSVVQILDSGPSQEVVNAYASVKEIKGGIYCFGEKYAAGNGSVYWANDKPFICVRETLWSADVKAMASRINGYKKDPSTIEGYTVINLHPWSMDYNDVKLLVSLLDENVEVISADDLIRLVTENVKHENHLLNR